MANIRKKISELTPLTSASLDTTIVGVNDGVTYKIELDVLAESVKDRINSIDVIRLNNLESTTGSYLTSLNGAISSSSQLTSSFDLKYTLSGSIPALPTNLISSSTQITDLGFISTSVDISYINQFTSSQSAINTAFTNGMGSRLTTSSFNQYTSSISTASLVDRLNSIENETSSFLTNLNGAISSSSQLTSSFDDRYTLSGSVQSVVLPTNLVSSSTQITALGFISSSASTDISSLNSFTASQSTLNTAFTNGISARLQTSSFNDYTSSVNNRITTLEGTIISGSPNYTQVLGNRRTNITTIGVSIISGSITTTGNPVQIMVTGDANPIVDGWTRLQIFRGETGIGNIIQVENSSNQNVPYCLNVIDTPSEGTYSYSMRTVSGHAGTFDFGETTGPLLTAVELKTNTNLPSTNNTFTGTNTFNGGVRFGTNGGDEGGEISFGLAQTNNTLTGSVIVDVYRNQLRLLESGGTARGVNIDLSKAPNNANGELIWKTSGIVNAGTFVTLDNLKVTITTSGNRGLSVASVSGSFTCHISGWYAYNGSGASNAENITYTTTPSNSAFGWHFGQASNTAQYHIYDLTNSRFYRITIMIHNSYNNNFISIERLF